MTAPTGSIVEDQLMEEYRVLQGFQASAGQPGLLARGLRARGIDAANVVVGPNRYGYPADFVFADNSRPNVRRILTTFGNAYDIFHIHAVTPFFVKGSLRFPMGTDLLALKASGKRIIVHFRGSEVRQASLFKALSPYHYVDDDPEGLFTKFPQASQRAYIDLCRAIADEIVVSDPELLSYVPNARVIPRAIDLEEWPLQQPSGRTQPLVVHAPSRKGVKGTQHILAAVDSLKSEGLDFEFQMIEGKPQDEARQLYKEADIIIDQLRIGWYGVLAVEGMALGKAVISYIRDDLVSEFGGMPPVHIANPETIKAALRELVVSPEAREAVARRGYEYCLNVHDVRKVSEACARVYDEVVRRPTGINIGEYFSVNELQEEWLNEDLKQAKSRGASNAVAAYKAKALNSKTQEAPHYLRKVWKYYQRVGARNFASAALRKITQSVRLQ